MVTIHNEGVIFIHSVGDALSIARAELSRDQISGEDGILPYNVLVANNYRDRGDDATVGKLTTVVIFSRKVMGIACLLSGFIGKF